MRRDKRAPSRRAGRRVPVAPAPAAAQPIQTLDAGVSGAINIWLTFGGGLNGTPVVHLDEPGLYRFNLTDNVGQHNYWLSGPPAFAEQRTPLFETPIPGLPPPPHHVWDLTLPAGVYRYQCEHHAFMAGMFTVGDALVVSTETGFGFITSDPPGVNWPANRGAAFPAGTRVTLTATPQNESFTFNGWLAGCSGIGPCTVVVHGRTEVRAVFGTPVGGGGGTVAAPATLTRLAVRKTKAGSAGSNGLAELVQGCIIARVRRVLLLLACAALIVPSAVQAQTEPLAVLDGGVSGQITHWLTFGDGPNGQPVVHLEEAGLYRFMILDNSAGHNFWLTGPAPNQLVFRTVFESQSLPPPDPNGPPQQFDRVLESGIYRYQCENHAFMTGWFSVGDVVVVQTESGHGLITSSPAGVNWPSNRGAAFPAGTQVTLTATPQNSSFTFNGWIYACNGVGGCTVTVNGRTEVRAVFGTPVAPTAPATISKLAVKKVGARRTVRVTLNVKRETHVTAQLRKSSRVVVAKTARLTAGSRLVTLAVPKKAKAGLYTVRVALRDLAGNSFSSSRSIRIPR